MKLNSFSLAALVIVFIFGGIGFSTAMNWWQTESAKVPALITEGEFAGQYNPADIRGSYTFGDVSKNFSIPVQDLATAFRLPADVDAASFGVKDLETTYADLPVEMGTSSVRLFTAFYKGLPYDLSGAEETYLFQEAAEILVKNGNMQPDQAEFLATHILTTEAAPVETAVAPAEEIATPTPEVAATEHIAPDMTVTGATTFQNLLDWGMSQESIESVIGKPMPASQMLVKDYAVQLGQTFSGWKTALQAELDKLK
jgi:hypothetical protein